MGRERERERGKRAESMGEGEERIKQLIVTLHCMHSHPLKDNNFLLC